MKKILTISAIALILFAIFAQVSIISPAIAQPPSLAELTGTVYDYGDDTDTDGLYNYLAVDVEVNVSVAGNCIVEIEALEGENYNYLYFYKSQEVYLDVGAQNVSFTFSGIAMHGRQLNVTNLYQVSLYDQDYNFLDYYSKMFLSATYDYTLFDTGATLTGTITDEGIDTNSNGLFNTLQVGVEVDVADAGEYEVYISELINVSGYYYEYISVYNNTVEFLSTGIQFVNVSLPGATVYASHATNIVKVSFISLNLREGYYSYQLDSKSYLDLSRGYSYDEFETTAYFTGTVLDEGVDEDANAKFDYLQIGLEVNVIEAGEYYVTLQNLVDNASNYVNVYESFYGYLDVGVHLINITVYGPTIYTSHVNPMYIGQAEISTWSGGIVLDRLTEAPLSTTYNYDDFESHALLTGSVSDMGVDKDGDGLYDYLAIGIEVDVTEAGEYTVFADGLVEQVNDTYYENLYAPLSVEDYFNVGTHMVYLNYSGPRLAYEHFSPTNITNIRLQETEFPYLQLDYVTSAPLSTRYDYALFDAPLRDMQINLVVYPDGTMGIGGIVNGTHAYPPNEEGSVNATLRVSTNGDVTVITTDGAFLIPEEYMTWPLDAMTANAFVEYKNGLLNVTLNAAMFVPSDAISEYPANATDFTLSATYSGGQFNVDISGQTEIPSFESMFPFNVSDCTVYAEYDGSEIRGNITFNAASSLPFTNVVVDFVANETSMYFTGGLMVPYGNYFDMEINATSLEEMLAEINSTIPGQGPDSLYNMTEGMLECTQLDTTNTPMFSGADVDFNATIIGNFTDAIAQVLNELISGGDPEAYPIIQASLNSLFSSVESASVEATYYHSSGTVTLTLHLTDDVNTLWSQALELIPPTVPDDFRAQLEAGLKIANTTAYAINDFGLDASYSITDHKIDLRAWLLANTTRLETDTLPLVSELVPLELRSVFESCLNTTYCTLTYSNATVNYVNGTVNFDANLILGGDFKAQLNHMKRCYIDYLNATDPWMLGPEYMLLNETEIDMNNFEAVFNISKDWMYISFEGIVVKPPKDEVDPIRFKLSEFFNATSYDSEEPPGEFDKLKIVVTGGFNGTHVVLPYAPYTLPAPDAISLDYKTLTWENVTMSSLTDLVFQIAYQEGVDYAGETYYVPVFTNSTMSGFSFNPSAKKIYFNVTGDAGTGFCKIIIPRSLLYAAADEWVVKIDGVPLNLTDLGVTENAEYVVIELNYSHSSHLVEILGTWVVPEFQPNAFALVLIAISLIVAIIAIKEKKKFTSLTTKYYSAVSKFAARCSRLQS